METKPILRLKNTPIWVVFIFLLFVSSCTSPDDPEENTKPPTLSGFSFMQSKNSVLPADVVGEIIEDMIVCRTPTIVDVSSLIPTFTTTDTDASVTVNNIVQESNVTANNFNTDLIYTVTQKSGKVMKYKVSVIVFTGLPVITINTEGGAPILNREDYVKATINVYGGKDHPEFNFDGAMRIKGRGNTTWTKPKKPYKMKFDKATPFFGFPADKEWVLLANYLDKSLLRNATAFQLSTILGMPYTTRYIPVEVYLNGSFDGTYQFCEQVAVAPSKVSIGADGWFLQVDNEERAVRDLDDFFHTPKIDEYTIAKQPDGTIVKGSVLVFKSPSAPSDAQRIAIKADVFNAEAALYGPKFNDPTEGYPAYFDIDKLIDWYLINELTKNNDAAFFSSVYMYKTPSSKITMGPIWDYDLSIGGFPTDFAPEGWKIKNSVWIDRFFDDRLFIDKLKIRWQFLKGQENNIYAFIDDYAAKLKYAQEENHNRWKSTYNPAQAPVYVDEVNKVKDFLKKRFAWLHTNIMNL